MSTQPQAKMSDFSKAPELELCDELPTWRKWVVLFITSWVALCATFASTSLFTAANEIANDFSVTPAAVYETSGGLLAMMGISSFIWGPVETVFGRRLSYNCCIAFLSLTTVASGLARSWPLFVTMRILSGLGGTYFHVTGQAILSENFAPVQRGTATGFFLSGTAMGPALGPCIAGIIVTYTDWRVILWLQAGMIGSGLILSALFIPASKSHTGLLSRGASFKKMVAETNPIPVFRLIPRPNIFLTNLSCGLLSWSQYVLLSAPRSIISKRFNFTSPLPVALFYLALIGGFLLGTIAGGRWSDRTVAKWIEKRGGLRLPQDRLNAGMMFFFLVIPGSQLAYGWVLECTSCSTQMSGLAVPVITGFLTAAGLLAAFASLNTYCAEVLPSERRRVIMTKYLTQYAFAASASAGAVPMINSIGYGPASTIGAVLVLVSGVLTWTTATHGLTMQRWYEHRFRTAKFDDDEEALSGTTQLASPL